MEVPKYFLPLTVLLLLLVSACSNNQTTTVPGDNSPPSLNFTVPTDYNPERKLLGVWYINFETGKAEPALDRFTQERINIADALLMPEFAGALDIYIDTYDQFGKFAPPSIK